MRLPGYLIGFFLTVLLASTTPVGTGAGVHQFDLLHPLFSHMHLVNGRLMTHEQIAAAIEAQPAPPPGVSLGTAGVASDEGGMGVSPTLPLQTPLIVWDAARRWEVVDFDLPASREEAPPKPPPLGY